MSTNTLLGTLRKTMALLDQLAAKPAPATAKAWQRFTATAEAVAKLDTRNDLGARVVEAIDADRDPFTDPAVIAAATREAVDRTRHQLDYVVGERLQAFSDEHAPALIAAMRPAFDKAAAVLLAARDALGDVDIDDTAAVLAQGGDAARVWTEARAASQTIEQIRDLWSRLAFDTRSLPALPRQTALVIVEPNPARWLDNADDAQATPWQLMLAGYVLALATPDTVRDRLGALEREQITRRDADQLAERRAFADSGNRSVPRPAA